MRHDANMHRTAVGVVLLMLPMTIMGCKDDTKLEGAPVELAVAGHPVILQMGNCQIYKVERSLLRGERKTRVLTTDFYLGFTVCTRQSLSKDGDYAIASLCRQAIGAGGGCATGATYRTRDGDHWEKDVGDGKWKPVDEPDAAPDAKAKPAKT
jgi:hypothetical protein